MRPVPKFAVGDKVTSTSAACPGTAELVAGPFVSSFQDSMYWVAERSDGKHATPYEHTLTKVTTERTIKPGDRVRVVRDDPYTRTGQFVGKVGIVGQVWGPDNELPFRVNFDDSQRAPYNTWNVAEVELVDEAPADTYTHDSVTYDLTACYRDKDGTAWRLARVGGVVRARTAWDGESPTTESRTLERVVQLWGPLTRV